MTAAELMFVACALYVVHRWATNSTAITAKIVAEAAFAILVVAMLDHGETESIARGFAWLFVIVAAFTTLPALNTVLGTKTSGTGVTTA